MVPARLQLVVSLNPVPPPGEFAGIAAAQGGGVRPDPIAQTGFPGGRGVGVKQVGLQALDFLPGDGHVADHFADYPTDHVPQGIGNGYDRPFLPDRPTDFLDELAVRERLRPDGVDHHVFRTPALFDGQTGQVIHIDGLQPVVSVAEDTEHGKLPQDPGNVVDEDVLFPE